MDYMIGIHITVIISVLLLIRLAFPRKFGNVPISILITKFFGHFFLEKFDDFCDLSLFDKIKSAVLG